MLNSSMKTADDMDTYAENSVSSVYYLFLEAMGMYFYVSYILLSTIIGYDINLLIILKLLLKH